MAAKRSASQRDTYNRLAGNVALQPVFYVEINVMTGDGDNRSPRRGGTPLR